MTQGLAGAGQPADCWADEKAHLDHCPVIQGLEMVLNETDFDWSLIWSVRTRQTSLPC